METKMHTEEDHKKLFKRFFVNDAKICKHPSSISYMKKNDGYFWCDDTDDWIAMIYYGDKPYTTFMRAIYGKDVSVYAHGGILDEDGNVIEKMIHYHVPSSYEEMCIICDLNGI